MKILPELSTTQDEDCLFVQAWKQEIHVFTNGYPIPERLTAHLSAHGFVPDEPNGLLFSGCGNVDFHVDDSRATALWCLKSQYWVNPPVLISGKDTEHLTTDSVIVFDSSKPHAVLAETNRPYLIYVLNVKRKGKRK